MDDFFSRAFHDLLGRVNGPMNVRLLIQPLIAAFFAVRAGLRDARAGNSPYFWAVAFDPAHRSDLRHQVWKDVSKVFIAALVLDVVYQFIALKMVYPVEAIIVAVVLAVLPYVVLRSAVTRLLGSKGKTP